MVLESVPAGQVSDGFGLVLFVPTIADPSGPTVAELTAGTVKKLTYSVTGDGYKHSSTVNKVKAQRLTLAQEIQYDGTVIDDLTITYAYTNTVSDVIRVALPVGTAGYIVERWAVDNATAIAAAQIVTVIPFKASIPFPDAPVKDQELTRTQALNVTGKVWRDVLVVA